MKAKKTVSTIISLAMLLSLIVVPVHAASNFTDVAANAYYVDSVAWAVNKGITTGKTATTFAPNEQCTKAQIITFLWRAFGSPEPDVEKINELIDFPNNNPFKDLNGSEYYFKAAQWAFTQGLTSGNADFNPNEPCTRVFAVWYMHITAGKPEPSKYTMFDDHPNNPILNAAISWAVEKGITNGTTATTFSPETICTRAQIVTFLYRYLGNQQTTGQPSVSTDNPKGIPMVNREFTDEERIAANEAGGKLGRGETHLKYDPVYGIYFYE